MLTCNGCGKENQASVRFCNWCGRMFSVAATGMLPAQSLLRNGRYLILETVGRGGMGAVYKALDTQLSNRIVAIKEMSQNGLTEPELQRAIATFTREAEMLVHLKHSSLPHVYEQFEDNARRYLVMEFIEGETLEDRLAWFQRQGSLPPLALVIDIGKQLCVVLDYLHSQHPPIVFRDLKPSNIMLDDQGRVYLIDFGIARLFKPGMVKDTVALGSQGYAPPEQYRQSSSPRSDIYSFGALLHQMLTGDEPAQNPFFFSSFSINNARLERLITSMVALDVQQRPTSVRVVREALDELTTEVVSRPSTTARGVKKKHTRSHTKVSVQTNSQVKTPAASSVPTIQASSSLRLCVVGSSYSLDERIWQRIDQQLELLLDGFPAIKIRTGIDGRSIDDAGLVLLLISDHFLSSPTCMQAVDKALELHRQRGLAVLSIMLRSCSLAGTHLEDIRAVPEDALTHPSLYAEEQRILEVAKTIRSLLVPVILAGKRGGPMNLLQWLLWQLYSDGFSACRYFRVGQYVVQHIRPAGAASILLHLFDTHRGRDVAEYLIGPLRCKDLTLLLHTIAPTATDPERVQGLAIRRRPQ